MKNMEFVVNFSTPIIVKEEEFLGQLSNIEFELYEEGKLNDDIINERVRQIALKDLDEVLETISLEEFTSTIKKQKSSK